MPSSALLLQIAALALPLALFWIIVRRTERRHDQPRRRLWMVAGTVLLAGLLFLPAWMLEKWIEAWAGVDEHASATGDVTALVYAFLVVAPLEQGLKVFAVVPAFRSRVFRTPRDGVLFGAAAAVGFMTAHDGEYLFSRPEAAIDLGRVLLAVPAHVFFAASWAFTMGLRVRDRGAKRLGGRAFTVTWLLSMLFNGVYDHIVFARGPAALLATFPILALMSVIAAYALRSTSDEAPDTPVGRVSSSGRRSFLPAIAPPSLNAVRAALWRAERPVMFRWIGFGALVTTGILCVMLASAVALGHRAGIDFSAVDRGDGTRTAFGPLVLLGGAALAAFPCAGYLVARASASHSVLEPAIAAGVAIAGVLVLLGLAAPVAVVFAIAFAPIAFGLACAGAWMGIKG